MPGNSSEDQPVGTGVLLEPEFVEECVEEEVEYEEDFFGNSEPKVKRKKSTYDFPISKASARAIYLKSGSIVRPVDGHLNIYPGPLHFKDNIRITIEDSNLVLFRIPPGHSNNIQFPIEAFIGNSIDQNVLTNLIHIYKE